MISSGPCISGAAYGRTRGRSCAWVTGSAAAIRRPIDVSSACAVSSVAPGASLPKTVMDGPVRGTTPATSVTKGIHSSCETGKAKPSGITPTTVA